MKTLGGYIFGPIFRWPVERQIPWHSLHGSDNPGSGQFPDGLKVISPSAFGVHQLLGVCYGDCGTEKEF